jgi:hypothetical protein
MRDIFLFLFLTLTFSVTQVNVRLKFESSSEGDKFAEVEFDGLEPQTFQNLTKVENITTSFDLAHLPACFTNTFQNGELVSNIDVETARYLYFSIL